MFCANIEDALQVSKMASLFTGNLPVQTTGVIKVLKVMKVQYNR